MAYPLGLDGHGHGSDDREVREPALPRVSLGRNTRLRPGPHPGHRFAAVSLEDPLVAGIQAHPGSNPGSRESSP